MFNLDILDPFYACFLCGKNGTYIHIENRHVICIGNRVNALIPDKYLTMF